MNASVAVVARATDAGKLLPAGNPFYARVAELMYRVIPSQPNESELRDQQHEVYGAIAITLMHGLISLEQHNALGQELARMTNVRLAQLRNGEAA